MPSPLSADGSTGMGVLFDVDGTLVDTTFVHTVCWAEALRQRGTPVPAARVHHAIGRGSAELLDYALGEDRDRDADDKLVDTHLSLYKQWWGRLIPLPGAAELLRACKNSGARVVLASSASDEELAAVRAVLDADDVIDVVTSSSDAAQGKPAPDIVQAALERSGLDAGRAVFVGDSVWDGQAAQRAGVPFVGLTAGGTPEAELRRSGAIEVWRDPQDLLTNISRSVLLPSR